MKKDPLFSKVYTLDPETNRYMVEIALDQYTDIFNEWDPAPFKRREIDPDLQIYLEGSSEEISFRHPLELCFSLPQEQHHDRTEIEAREGLQNSFVFKIYLLKRELKKINTQMLTDVFLGFAFLWIGKFVSNQFEETLAISLLAEGIFIGGWVFIWEAVSLFFFTNRDLYSRYRTYQRLLKAPIIFRYL